MMKYSHKIRRADFAGSWYPDQAETCIQEITSFPSLKKAISSPEKKIGGIVPHAGWFFSGEIAATVIAHLALANPNADTAVIFGMHLGSNDGNYIMRHGGWETPLGPLQVDEEFTEGLAKQLKFIQETPDNYRPDNAVELQLPFIKYFFKEIKIIAIGVPPNNESIDLGEKIVGMAQKLNRRIIVLGSTDLTHYGPNYNFMPKGSGKDALQWVKTENDRIIIDHFITLQPHEVIYSASRYRNSCCAGAAASAISVAKCLEAKQGTLLQYGTSYEKHPNYSFVGYAGVVF